MVCGLTYVCAINQVPWSVSVGRRTPLAAFNLSSSSSGTLCCPAELDNKLASRLLVRYCSCPCVQAI